MPTRSSSANQPLQYAHRARIVELAAKYRIPAMYESRDYPDVGGLISYGVYFPDLFRRAAGYVDKVLKGAKPADLPVEQADEVRAGHQPQDREGPRPHDPAVGARAGG